MQDAAVVDEDRHLCLKHRWHWWRRWRPWRQWRHQGINSRHCRHMLPAFKLLRLANGIGGPQRSAEAVPPSCCGGIGPTRCIDVGPVDIWRPPKPAQEDNNTFAQKSSLQ
jgi:hypothetical protein